MDGTPLDRSPLRIAVFEGDGIGPEITQPTLKLIEKVIKLADAPVLDFECLPAGAGHYRDYGEALPNSSIDVARAADAILLSAMGLPDIRYPNGTEIAPQIDLRKILSLYAGVRPVFVFPGQPCPLSDPRADQIDFVLIRESTEGLFYTHGSGELIGDSEARETLRITRDTSEKLFDFALNLATQRLQRGKGKGHVTCIDKANVFQAFAFFRKIFFERAEKFPQIQAGATYIDAMALRMIRDPWTLDILVTENMFGDILSDLGAGLMGGLGFAPSADIGDDHAVFQPCHGSAPDIAGRGWANPAAMILSGAMMLDWLGHKHGSEALISAGEMLNAAVAAVIGERTIRTRDFGGEASTEDFAVAVGDQLGKA